MQIGMVLQLLGCLDPRLTFWVQSVQPRPGEVSEVARSFLKSLLAMDQHSRPSAPEVFWGRESGCLPGRSCWNPGSRPERSEEWVIDSTCDPCATSDGIAAQNQSPIEDVALPDSLPMRS